MKPSAGQAADEPLQYSAASQKVAWARHMVAEDLKLLVGQTADVPVHFSATSQLSTATRQVVDEEW